MVLIFLLSLLKTQGNGNEDEDYPKRNLFEKKTENGLMTVETVGGEVKVKHVWKCHRNIWILCQSSLK